MYELENSVGQPSRSSGFGATYDLCKIRPETKADKGFIGQLLADFC